VSALRGKLWGFVLAVDGVKKHDKQLGRFGICTNSNLLEMC
jgi:hypothetical protein